jgi:hypothetical protein
VSSSNRSAISSSDSPGRTSTTHAGSYTSSAGTVVVVVVELLVVVVLDDVVVDDEGVVDVEPGSDDVGAVDSTTVDSMTTVVVVESEGVPAVGPGPDSPLCTVELHPVANAANPISVVVTRRDITLPTVSAMDGEVASLRRRRLRRRPGGGARPRGT